MSNELYHHGIVGMRWGHRKSGGWTDNAGNKTKSKKSDSYHEDYKTAHTKKSVKKMGNDELKSRNSRLQMENQYSALKIHQNQVMKGASYVAAAVAVTGGAISLYNNSNRIVEIGKGFVGK